MSRTGVDVAAAAEWSDRGGGRGSAGIRPSNLGKGKSGGGSGNGGGSRGSDSGGGGGNSGEDNGGAVEEMDQDGSGVGGPSGRVYPADWTTKTKAQKHRYKKRRRK